MHETYACTFNNKIIRRTSESVLASRPLDSVLSACTVFDSWMPVLSASLLSSSLLRSLSLASLIHSVTLSGVSCKASSRASMPLYSSEKYRTSWLMEQTKWTRNHVTFRWKQADKFLEFSRGFLGPKGNFSRNLYWTISQQIACLGIEV